METFVRGSSTSNLGSFERWASAIGGTALIVSALRRQRLVRGLLGADLIYRGATGHSYLYQFLGVSSRPVGSQKTPIPYRQGIRVDESITINKPAAEVYQFWRRFDNLPYFMEHLLSVTVTSATR